MDIRHDRNARPSPLQPCDPRAPEIHDFGDLAGIVRRAGSGGARLVVAAARLVRARIAPVAGRPSGTALAGVGIDPS